jgi:hypothetical protein
VPTPAHTHSTNRGFRFSLVAAVALLIALALGLSRAGATPVTVTNYTDPANALTWGQKSHWKQPWRSYMDTVPATTFRNAIGINFNVKAAWAETTATLLKDSGFTRARVEVSWRAIDYDHPNEMTENDHQDLVAKLTALKKNGLRPLIVLNSNHGQPCPIKHDTIQLMAPARPGDTAIHVNPLEAGKIALGRTGVMSGGVAAQYLFTSVSPEGTVHLSAPLGSTRPATGAGVSELPAGPLEIETLRYEPFHWPRHADGSADPGFESTIAGWLNYTQVVTREVESILGSEDFDVEIWNELSFGSRFLEVNNYYEPNLEESDVRNADEILSRSVAYIRDRASGVPNIGIGDGFANQTPWPSAANTPVGLTAIDKHPYPKIRSYPADAQVGGNRPLDGLGEPAGEEFWNGGWREWREVFTPTYEAFFPEYFLAGIQTETLIHDLAPTMSKVSAVEHGRFVHAPGGEPATEWITELNMNPASGPAPAGSMTQADIRHVETKEVLRSLVAFVNKGVTAVHFFAVRSGNLSLVDPAFFAALHGSVPAYPGDAAGGETMAAVRRLAESMGGAESLAAPRSLSLDALTDFSSNVQFAGNGTSAYPPLYNRDVFAFLPFQVTARRFAIPVYVMTRNMAEEYGGASGPARFDLPEEPYRLEIGGVNGERASVSATDPITGEITPAEIVAQTDHDVTVEMGVTDSPRVLTIEEAPEGTPPPPEEEGGDGGTPGSGEPTPEGTPEPRGPAANRASGASGTNFGAGDVPPPRFELRHRQLLLTQNWITVIAQFRAPYAGAVRGSLNVGGRGYALDAKPSQIGAGGTGAGRATTKLAVPGRTARAARQALQRGRPVRLTVVVEAQSTIGGMQATRRVFSVRP